MEILDQRKVVVESPTEKLFRERIETGKLRNDFNLVVTKLKIRLQVRVNLNLRVTNLCSC